MISQQGIQQNAIKTKIQQENERNHKNKNKS